MFFLREIKPPEHKCFYSFQLQQENTHMETYCEILRHLDAWEDASAIMAKYKERKSAAELLSAMAYVTDDDFEMPSFINWGDINFSEILLRYAMRKYMFTATLHYLLYKLSGVFKLEKPSECWCRIQIDCNSFASFASFLYTQSKNKGGSECIEYEKENVMRMIHNFMDDEIFNHVAWLRVLDGTDDQLANGLSELRNDVIDFTQYAAKHLSSIIGGVTEDEAPSFKKHHELNEFPVLNEIMSLHKKKEKSKKDLEKEIDDIFTMDSDF
jgi:ribonucleotide reductase beta subunit family protein with ferritin-like domain